MRRSGGRSAAETRRRRSERARGGGENSREDDREPCREPHHDKESCQALVESEFTQTKAADCAFWSQASSKLPEPPALCLPPSSRALKK